MDQYKARLIFVSALLAIALVVVVGKFFTIQILDGKKYAMRSREQVQQTRIINAKRGDIYDRSGRRLATSVPGQLSVSLDVLGVEGRGEATLQRVYPMGDLAGAVLGYVGRDGYGLGGAEFAFDHHLRGEDGWEMVHRDGRQRTYRRVGMPVKEPQDGSDVYLTIDANLQKIVESALVEAVAELEAKGGVAVVMDPHTGKILAMANAPSFNPNVATSYTLAQRRNRIISQVYEPGSTFKVITAAIALEEGIANEHDTLSGNNGVFEIFGEVIRDDVPQGDITFTRALAVSSNVVFARVANRFTNDMFFRHARDFGFGAKSGVMLPGEEQGILHPVRAWSGRTRVTMAYGYEVSATFLQMVMAYGSVANGGVLLAPVISERVVSQDGAVVEAASVRPVRRVMSQEVSARLRGMMRETVESGTGRLAAIPNVSVAGKTGTTRKLDAGGGGYSRTRHWASFIGFMPAENPVLLCGVMIDEPSGGRGGGAAAAPVFRKILTQALAHPELEFSGSVFRRRHNDQAGVQNIRLPDFTGFSRASASRVLDTMEVAYKIEGVGDVIRYQTPSAGSSLNALRTSRQAREIILFTDIDDAAPDGAVTVIPNMIGRDLRDAFNMMNALGVPVYAVGNGTVARQSLAPGSLLRRGDNGGVACTIYAR